MNTYRYRRLAACLLATTLAAGVAPDAASAQVDLLGPGAAFLSAGVARVSTAELDDWLGARGYPTHGRTATTVGLGGSRVLASGVMLGLEAQGFIIGSDEYGDGEMGLGAGYATLGLAYAVDATSRVRVYPRVGLGAGGMALWMEAADTLDFEDVLEDQTAAPPRAPNLARDGVVLDLGIGAELLPPGGSGLLVGVRAGWLTGPFTDTWEMYEHSVNGGPDASLNGPYVRIVAGWAWGR